MEIFHAHVQADTIQVVSRIPELQTLIRELCHRFKVQAISHNRKFVKDYMDPAHVIYTSYTPEENERAKEETLRKATRVLLAYPSGVPFGVAFIKTINNKGNEQLAYAFSSNFTVKERGRGEDRFVRESTNIQSLMKSIQKCNPLHEQQMFRKLYSIGIHDTVQSRVKAEIKLPWRSPDVSREATMALIDYFLEGKKITDDGFVDEIKKAVDLRAEIDKKHAEIESTVNEFCKEIYVIGRIATSPTISVARAEYNKAHDTFEIIGDIKCYASVDDLPRDLLLTYKMWKIKHETKLNFSLRSIPNADSWCSDFNVLLETNNIQGFNSLNRVTYFATPVMDQANGN